MGSHGSQIKGSGTERHVKTKPSSRATALIERFTHNKDWRTGESRPIDTHWAIQEKLKTLISLTRQTKTAATTISKLIETYGECLTADESEALQRAALVLTSLGYATTHANESVKRTAKAILAAEEDRRKTAQKAVKARFDGIEPRDLVVFLLTNESQSYAAKDRLRDMRADIQAGKAISPTSLHYPTEDVLNSWRSTVESDLKKGMTADESIDALWGKFIADKTSIEIKEADFLNAVVAAFVQWGLTRVE